jgi:hypothetical protein
MSLAELKQAVHELSRLELAELAAFIRQEDEKVWDAQIDEDFAEGGKLRGVIDEVRRDLRSGQVGELP